MMMRTLLSTVTALALGVSVSPAAKDAVTLPPGKAEIALVEAAPTIDRP